MKEHHFSQTQIKKNNLKKNKTEQNKQKKTTAFQKLHNFVSTKINETNTFLWKISVSMNLLFLVKKCFAEKFSPYFVYCSGLVLDEFF